MKIGLYDLEFAHVKIGSYHDYVKSKYIQWDRETPENNNIIVYTERCYEKARQTPQNKTKIAWALESPEIHKYAIDNLKNGLHNNFDYILTQSISFIEWLKNNSNTKGIWFTAAGGWILEKDHNIYPKTKMLQMIASKKDYAPGHKLRFQVADMLGDKVDKYGFAFKSFVNTIDVFKDYRFAIVIENCIHPDYFTDKLTSAFYTGTIPIFWNDGFIVKYFNPKGMFIWQTLDELKYIIDNKCNRETYNRMIPYALENFEIAKKYYSVEDYMYNSFFGNLNE